MCYYTSIQIKERITKYEPMGSIRGLSTSRYLNQSTSCFRNCYDCDYTNSPYLLRLDVMKITGDIPHRHPNLSVAGYRIRLLEIKKGGLKNDYINNNSV